MATPDELQKIDIDELAQKHGLKKNPSWPKSLFGAWSPGTVLSDVYEIMKVPVIFNVNPKFQAINAYIKIPEDLSLGHRRTKGFSYVNTKEAS